MHQTCRNEMPPIHFITLDTWSLGSVSGGQDGGSYNAYTLLTGKEPPPEPAPPYTPPGNSRDPRVANADQAWGNTLRGAPGGVGANADVFDAVQKRQAAAANRRFNKLYYGS